MSGGALPQPKPEVQPRAWTRAALVLGSQHLYPGPPPSLSHTPLLGLAERLCFPPCPHPYPLQWLAGQGDMGGGGKQSPGSREEAEAPGEISEAGSRGCCFWWSLESGGGEGIIVPGRRQDSFVPRALATRTKLFSGFAVSPAGEVKGRLGAGKAGPPALQTWGGGQGPPPQCFRLTRRLLGATR